MSEQAANPALAQERAHVAATLAIVAREREVIAAEITEQATRVDVLHREAGGIYSEQEEVAGNVLRFLQQTAHTLGLSAQRPYFTRVDFTPEHGAPETHYIGKWGVLKTPELESIVVDWRSPVANLYYSGQVGPMHYVAPDGEVRGELTLKRHLTVEDGELRGVFDTDVVSQDAYLQQALAAVSPTKLKEIVSTIQAEQNIVIRHPLDKALIVQGVAGSGKTTIALHRIAWLLYAYQQRLAPEQMVILAPNPMFLDYISAVLPDLGVERVRQCTYPSLLREVLGKAAPKPRPDDTLERVLAETPAQRAETTLRLRYMGSLRFRDALLAYLSKLEAHIVPGGELRFGPVKLYTQAELQRIVQQDLAAFPLHRRVQELGKYIKRKLQQAQAQVEGWLRQECERRVQALLSQMPDGAERQQRMTKLYDSRDRRLAEVKEEAKTFIQKTLAAYPKLDVAALYTDFLRTPAAQLPPEDQAAWDLVQQHSEMLTEHPRAGSEDLPALALIARRVTGWGRQDIRHLVIDEAQDLSPLQVWVLKELSGNSSFTIVGDLMQGVHGYRGLADWTELTGGVFDGLATFHTLVTSYRNTVEIMEFATRVAQRHAVPGQTTPRPVLRHGPAPLVQALVDAKHRLSFITEQVAAWRAEGFGSIALIVRDEAAGKALYKALPPELGAHLLGAEDTSFPAGLMILPAVLVKGLEFDCVLVCDVDAVHWPDETLEARLLYVCLTRPLHRLTCCYVGQPSMLLAGNDRREEAEGCV